jgi:hypothetical protein
MIGFAALLPRLGLSDRLARMAAWPAVILAVLAGVFILKGCYDRAVIQRHTAKLDNRAAAAREQSGSERLRDAMIVTANEKDLHHAIRGAPAGGELSPPARALACERLRKIGRIPVACRPDGGDGAQAHSQ